MIVIEKTGGRPQPHEWISFFVKLEVAYVQPGEPNIGIVGIIVAIWITRISHSNFPPPM
jgi:hypothetical protein